MVVSGEIEKYGLFYWQIKNKFSIIPILRDLFYFCLFILKIKKLEK